MEVAMTSTTQRSDFLGADEDMEISSEAGRGQESDIEIFDLDEDIATNAGDDEMVDDNDNEQKDEVMDEEFGRENTVDMDDEIVFDEDVEITEVAEPAPPTAALPDKPLIEVSEARDSPERGAEATSLDPNPSLSDEHTHSTEEVPVAEGSEPATALSQEATVQRTEQTLSEGRVAAEVDASGVDNDSAQNQPEKAEGEGKGEESVAQKTTDEAEGDVLYGQSADPKVETEGEPPIHATLSHEVKVIYKQNEMCLFAPSDPEDSRTYLLQDTALLHSPMSELFPACRTVLADSIAATDELHFEIPDLRLRLSEKAATKPAATLSHVIDVYLALSYNDSSDEPGPLYLNLDVVPDFQTRLDSLHDLASEGQGFSSIIEPDDSSDDDEWAEEEEESNIKAEEQITEDALAEVAIDPTSQPEVVKDELETNSSLRQGTETLSKGSAAETHEEIGDEAEEPEPESDHHEDNHDDKVGATAEDNAEAQGADQDASDTSATVQEEQESPPEGSQASRKAEDNHHEKSETLAEGEENAHGDDFDFDLGPGNEEDDKWHQEGTEEREHEQNQASISKAAETGEPSSLASAGQEHSGVGQNISQSAQLKAEGSEQNETAVPSHAFDVSENHNGSLHEDEWPDLDVAARPGDAVEAAGEAGEQSHHNNPGSEDRADGQQEHLPDDDDVINFSEDEEAEETTPPSISHKRSRSELGAEIDSVTEGSDLKKVKT